MIERTKRENENLLNLKNEMKDMSAGFEVLKNNRIERKREIDQRFEDTYEEIRENKQQTIQAMKEVDEIVTAFKQRFQEELQALGDNLR